VDISKKILVFVFTLLISACDVAEKPSVSKLKDTPETQKMLADFHQQEHRLEFSGCRFKYNDEQFGLDDNFETIKGILGAYEKTVKGYENEEIYYWMGGLIKIFFVKGLGEISALGIKLEKAKITNTPYYLLVDGVPLTRDMTMGKFILETAVEKIR